MDKILNDMITSTHTVIKKRYNEIALKWPEGMYIAKTMTADGPLSRTFVVQHRR